MKQLLLALSLSFVSFQPAISAEGLNAEALKRFLNDWQKLSVQEPETLAYYQQHNQAKALKLVCSQNSSRPMQIKGLEQLEILSQSQDSQTYKARLQLETEGFPQTKCSEIYQLTLQRAEDPLSHQSTWILSSAQSTSRREWIIKPTRGVDPTQLKQLGQSLQARLKKLGSSVPAFEIKAAAGSFVVSHALNEILPDNWQEWLTQTYQLSFKLQNLDDQSWQTTSLGPQHIQSAQAQLRDPGLSMRQEWLIVITLTPEGQQLLSKISKQNDAQKLGIFIDDRLLTAPQLNGQMTSNQVIIEGSFTDAEIKELANMLNMLPLEMPMSIQSNRIVAP